MTRREEIAVINKCIRTIYDYARRRDFYMGEATNVLRRKRRRLEKKLKR